MHQYRTYHLGAIDYTHPRIPVVQLQAHAAAAIIMRTPRRVRIVAAANKKIGGIRKSAGNVVIVVYTIGDRNEGDCLYSSMYEHKSSTKCSRTPSTQTKNSLQVTVQQLF